MNDTNPKSEQVLISRLRVIPLWRKFRQAAEMTIACRKLSASGIISRHPDIPEDEFRKRMAALWLEPALVKKVYNWDPAHEGY